MLLQLGGTKVAYIINKWENRVDPSKRLALVPMVNVVLQDNRNLALENVFIGK